MNRGSGNHLRVSNSTNIPVDWKSFLRCDANKYSLFHLLADAIREFHPPQWKESQLHVWPECCIFCHSRPLRPVLRRRGHTASLSHASHSFRDAFTKLIIHATDSVVVVLAIAVSIVLQHCEVWVAFGHGSKLRFIPCHLIAAKLCNDGVFL